MPQWRVQRIVEVRLRAGGHGPPETEPFAALAGKIEDVGDIVWALDVSPDGRWIAGIDPVKSSVVIWSAETQHVVHRWEVMLSPMNTVAFVGDSRRSLAGSRVIDGETGFGCGAAPIGIRSHGV